MARFIITAQPATFIDCPASSNLPAYQMVSVTMMAPYLLNETVDCRDLDKLGAAFMKARADLDDTGEPYSLRARLHPQDRAPRGWKDLQARFRFDQSFHNPA